MVLAEVGGDKLARVSDTWHVSGAVTAVPNRQCLPTVYIPVLTYFVYTLYPLPPAPPWPTLTILPTTPPLMAVSVFPSLPIRWAWERSDGQRRTTMGGARPSRGSTLHRVGGQCSGEVRRT